MPDALRPERLLAAILELTQEAVLTIGIDGTIEEWSPGAEALYGYTAAQIAGEPLRRLVPLYETPGLEALLNKIREGELLHWDSTGRMTKTGMRVRIMAKRVALRNGDRKLVGVLEKAQALEWAGSDVPAETQLRLVAKQMPALLWTADRELRITSNWGAGQPWSGFGPARSRDTACVSFWIAWTDTHLP